jgi:hypothetical protein
MAICNNQITSVSFTPPYKWISQLTGWFSGKSPTSSEVTLISIIFEYACAKLYIVKFIYCLASWKYLLGLDGIISTTKEKTPFSLPY